METKMTLMKLALLVSLAAAAGGCTAGSASDAGRTESLGVARQADSAPFTQTFDEAAQAVVFQPTVAIDWVILHVTIDGVRTTNVAMPASGGGFAIGSLPVVAGDSVAYSFTYSVSGLAHDSAPFSHALAASFQPAAFFTRVQSSDAGKQIAVVSTAPLAWADAHYTINGGPQRNVRLAPSGSSLVTPVTLAPGDVLRYSVTYSTGAAVFDTAVSTYGAAAVGDHFVVDLGADSDDGVCSANGGSSGQCNLRAAFLAAGTATPPVTIELAVDSVVSLGTIAAASPNAVTVQSASGGPARSISGTATSRLFQVASGSSLALSTLTITNFSAPNLGAAILNDGTLDLQGVTIAKNAVSCFDVGAMTAFATCSGGALASSGTVTIGGGTSFTGNSVTADAATAAFTNAWAGGGAIESSGTLTITGPVTFSGNSAVATATSGPHPEPIGGATASSNGGAIENSGTLTITGAAGSCQFLSNAATSTGSTIYGSTSLSSAGGAIENTGTLQIAPGTCVFSGNTAQSGADIDG